MYRVIILPFAKQDIKDAALWYNSRQSGLGKRFTTHIREKINYLKQDPLNIAVRYEEVRTSVLDIFPFMIHYIIDETQK